MDQATSRGQTIKNVYLYLVSFVALMMIVFSVADVLNIFLRTYVFTKADKDIYYYPEVSCPTPAPTASGTPAEKPAPCVSQEEQMKRNEESRSAQKQRDLVRDFSMIIVGIPLFAYHWRIVRRKE